ncbi:MAG TPA: peptidylprolyl isomerase [Rhizomicrobium sp.]|jgi:peptidyl-prolyl cis-trans isomerase SurA|nr:peptidylprolyl isomerase [Rhizomicrobium sp.]
MNDARETLILLFPKIAFAGAIALGLAAASAAAVSAPHREAGQQVASNEPTQPNAADLAGSVVHHGDGVAAIVNDSVISDYDLRQRMALFIATSGVKPSADSLNTIRDQVLKQLETEQMQLMEARKDNVSVSSGDVDKAINDILKSNNLTMDQLKSVLSQGGVDIATLRSQISVQIAWSKLVQDQLGDRVHIAPEDVDAELARIKQAANKPRYLVSEIFQAVDSPEQDAKVQKGMSDLYNQIQLGAPFSSVARQFSQNPTAAQGGDLGWVQAGQLPPELEKRLTTMNVGDATEPIRAAGGYYILELRDKQEPAGSKLPDAPKEASGAPGTLPLVRVLIPIGPKPAKDLADRAMQAAGVLREHLRDCTRARDVVSHMPGAVYMSLGSMKLADLSTDMQAAIAKTGPGESTVPFQSSAGIELILRCDKAVPKESVFVIPTRDQVEQQLYEQQMTVLARRYMRDLRREADVETR